MRTILRHVYRFSSQKYVNLPEHIANIMEKDQAKSNPKYESCRKYFHEIQTNCSDQHAKIKYNMIFNTNCASETLNELKPILSQLILREQLKTQYDLDQTIKWLTKEIKNNRHINEKDILEKLSRKQQQIKQFQEQLPRSSQSFTCFKQATKYFRNKYLTIDSRLIYQKLGCIFNNKDQGQPDQVRKEKKIWDKLLDIKPRLIKQQCNSKDVYEEHLKITDSKPRFRFPPEPNGFLHIGHVKSIRTNFQSAAKLGGICYLRYDDTNPDKETLEFIKQIEDNVKWLGYTPDKITFASDYFQELMGYASELIKKGHAYVCDSSKNEIQQERRLKKQNPYRNRNIQQSLKIFPNLTFNQTLRLKGIPDSPNPTLRDPIIYRCKQKSHPRTGNKYKIYPIYDFAHCISDSIEHIDYSLCSLEFQVRRELYYQYLDLLNLYKPTVWQYSRLNIQGNILSKRNIQQLINKGCVEGWDDPRLLTIRGLINRGYTADMLIRFIDKINCARTGNENTIQYSLLERQMKKELYKSPNKAIAILQPKRIAISSSHIEGFKQVQPAIYIEIEDYKHLKEGDFVILKYGGAFKIQRKKDDDLMMVRHKLESDITTFRKSKPQAKIINWLNESQSEVFKVVIYDRLLKEDKSFNQQSKIMYDQARVPKAIITQRPKYILLERNGFFKFSDDHKELRLCTSV